MQFLYTQNCTPSPPIPHYSAMLNPEKDINLHFYQFYCNLTVLINMIEFKKRNELGN
jgi:hypothetical protein